MMHTYEEVVTRLLVPEPREYDEVQVYPNESL